MIYFNPLPPHGGRPDSRISNLRRFLHFNPLPPHGGRHLGGCARSIRKYFNPLPPHGGRLDLNYQLLHNLSFQSTPSAWRETWHFTMIRHGIRYFNPLPPHGGRPGTTAPYTSENSFQSTPSAWRETKSWIPSTSEDSISIHSLRMEGDTRPVRHISMMP